MYSKKDSDCGVFTKENLLGKEKTSFKMFEMELVLLDLIAAKEFYFPSHKQCLPAFLIVLEGTYQGVLNGEPIEVTAGQLLFFPPNMEREDKCSSPCKFLVVMFALHNLWNEQTNDHFFEADIPSPALVISYAKNKEIRNLISTIIQSDKDDVFVKEKIIARGILLTWILISRFENYIPENTKNQLQGCLFANQLSSYFSKRLEKKYNAGELCAYLKISRRSLEMKCRKLFNQSPAKLFMVTKMHYAEKRLLTGISSKQVAQEIGFASQFSFSAAFKQYTGRCPIDYSPLKKERLREFQPMNEEN